MGQSLARTLSDYLGVELQTSSGEETQGSSGMEDTHEDMLTTITPTLLITPP
uniref:Uncharacterized protein n=1 Tax=Brassica campestris TaxID=3711 RepID=A0A3P5ZYR5_BRACM|nr:unnamed protein product [Brassica rapa]